jgi:hypothetical protein
MVPIPWAAEVFKKEYALPNSDASDVTVRARALTAKVFLM